METKVQKKEVNVRCFRRGENILEAFFEVFVFDFWVLRFFFKGMRNLDQVIYSFFIFVYEFVIVI